MFVLCLLIIALISAVSACAVRSHYYMLCALMTPAARTGRPVFVVQRSVSRVPKEIEQQSMPVLYQVFVVRQTKSVRVVVAAAGVARVVSVFANFLPLLATPLLAAEQRNRSILLIPSRVAECMTAQQIADTRSACEAVCRNGCSDGSTLTFSAGALVAALLARLAL